MKFVRASLLRYLLQTVSLVSFVLLLASLSYPPGLENLVLQWFSRLDPWILLSQLRWQKAVPSWVWIPILTLAASLLWGRIFCGWLCPFGALLELTDKIGRMIFTNLQLIRAKVLHVTEPVRGHWLIFLLIVFALGSNWVFFLSPFALFSHEIVRILQGEIPWMLMGIMAGTLLFSRLWCSVLCPTGVLFSYIARLRFFRYGIAGNCMQCGKCTRTCSVGAAPLHTGVSKEGCLACGDCQRSCPTKAIKWQWSFGWGKNSQATDETAAVKLQESRRQFFKTAFAVTMAAAVWKKTVWAAEKALRPPGALPEPELTAVCNRCGRCIQVCPSKALQPMPITDGLANFETPYIIPRKKRCDLCLSCQKVCPTGAITQVSLEKVRMGKAVIDKPRCIAWTEAKACLICGEQCPVLAIDADEQHRPIVQADKCVGCGSCENACPIDGEAAIRVIPI
ncbi:MAG: rsxB 9 [Sporomusa sp.]|jgi:ferredoxin-type protein NapH|nr:rsxB 9 [Sporomusa sp.]